MKIIVLKPFLVAKTNGGEISLIERLRLLQNWGIEVCVYIALNESERESSIAYLQQIGTPLNSRVYEVDGISCHLSFGPQFSAENLNAQAPMESYFLDIISREKPDLVWTHYTDFFATTAALEWNAEKTWVDMTDNEFPRIEKLESVPSVAKPYRTIQYLMVASNFMEKECKKAFPNSEILLLPNIIEFLSERPFERSNEAWVFVNPTYVKGVDFVMDLARRLPQEKFLFIGNWIGERPALMPPNVSFVPRQNNLKEIFKRAKGLLMPSVWEEAFGRVPLEAMAVGVPVIASDRGGLKDTLGGAGKNLPLDINLWMHAMGQPPELWKENIQKGYLRVEEYKNETSRRYEDLKQRLSENAYSRYNRER